MTCDIPTTQGQDGKFYMLGGGMDKEESEIQTLLREVDEESLGKIKLVQDNCKYISICKILATQSFVRNNIEYNGKEMSFWFYKFDSTQFEILESIDTDIKYDYKWIKLETLIQTNTHLTYPIWREFCKTNGIDCFEPNERIKTQYLAWSLDKNRITTLNEFGLESDCILNYLAPNQEQIKWKKISLEQSVENLVQLLPVLEAIYIELEPQRQALFASEINNLPTELENQAKLWEIELKAWIGKGNKDAGSYFWPLRTALSGKSKSPSPFEILAILSLAEIKTRIQAVIK